MSVTCLIFEQCPLIFPRYIIYGKFWTRHQKKTWRKRESMAVNFRRTKRKTRVKIRPDWSYRELWTISNSDCRASVTEMLDKLGWRTLEQRWADAHLCLIYKIVYGLVAVPLPDYVQYNNRISRYCHSMTFRQVSTSTDFYKYSLFSLAIIQLNALPESFVCLQRLDAFKTAICKLQHSGP